LVTLVWTWFWLISTNGKHGEFIFLSSTIIGICDSDESFNRLSSVILSISNDVSG
jgi:hypothetical protein